MSIKKDCFTPFQAPIDGYELPKRFNFPFYYEPHPLAVLATKELQDHIQNQTEWNHNFGLDPNKKGLVIGKMFGVLVVQNKAGELGYLSAFSGKLADKNHHAKFVPPVFDILTKDGFFNIGIVRLNEINKEIKEREQDTHFLTLQKQLKAEKTKATQSIQKAKDEVKALKKIRKKRREHAKTILTPMTYQLVEETMIRESQMSKIRLKYLTLDWNKKLSAITTELEQYRSIIKSLKEERQQKSAALQQKIFEHYQFLNQAGERKDLTEIFVTTMPTAGAGECAAPKLLQYAFSHQLKPITMAEFWWGAGPKSEVRQHQNFYPACRSKCKPILGHMLEGIDMDENPMHINTALGRKIPTVYEDDQIVVVNKPTEFLSVPGKSVQDSVLFRMQLKYPDATGPLVVHRLDMSTSGLMIIAKNLEAYKYLQQQFIKRKVKKRYIAILDGIVRGEKGLIDLPLRVDLEDRPRQLVCYEHGKNARTNWEVISRKDGKTRIHFFPITGRTHQLRVHSAHPLGLNIPIIGDDLYGKKTNRLYLHAESISFIHPMTKEMMTIEIAPSF